jgi:hypothetical protein
MANGNILEVPESFIWSELKNTIYRYPESRNNSVFQEQKELKAYGVVIEH